GETAQIIVMVADPNQPRERLLHERRVGPRAEHRHEDRDRDRKRRQDDDWPDEAYQPTKPRPRSMTFRLSSGMRVMVTRTVRRILLGSARRRGVIGRTVIIRVARVGWSWMPGAEKRYRAVDREAK